MTNNREPNVGELRPVRWRPRTFQFLGTGLDVIGRPPADDSTGEYRVLYTLSVLFIPIWHWGSFRVVDTPTGRAWIGREPLSGGAKAWNGLVLTAFLMGCGILGYQHYRRTPSQLAARKMDEIQNQLEPGDKLEAARAYSSITRSLTDSSEEAHARFQKLLDQLPGETSHEQVVEILALADALDRDAYSINMLPAIEAFAQRDFPSHPVDILERIDEWLVPRNRAAAQKLLQQILNGPALDLPAENVVTTFEAAVRLRNHNVQVDLLEPTREWLTRHGEQSPTSALALLDLVLGTPAANLDILSDDRLIRDQLSLRRHALLETAVASEPANLDYALALAQIDASGGHFDSAIRLLEPHAANLGSGEGARILGEAYAAQGRGQDAIQWLRPYVQARFAEMRVLQQTYSATFEQKKTAILHDIRTGAAPDFDRAAFDAAANEEKERILGAYVKRRLLSHSELQQLQRKLLAAQAVAPVCLQLGSLLVKEAQRTSDPMERAAIFQEAEETLLKIKGDATASTAYRLSLAETNYWLGKSTEGWDLLEQVLASESRSVASLMQVSTILRRIGDVSTARRLAEEAYENADGNSPRWAIATHLAALADDPAERIRWLEKSNPTDWLTEANLADARGALAVLKGDSAAAIEHFRHAIELYELHPDHPAAINNAGRSLAQVFQMSGQREDLQRATDKLERAFELQPSDPFIGGNLVGLLEQLAVHDVIGPRLDLVQVQLPPDLSRLAYLFDDASGQLELAAQFGEHKALARGLSVSERVMILAPQSANSYRLPFDAAVFLEDGERLASLAATLEGVAIPLSDLDHEWIAFVQGKPWPRVEEQTRMFAEKMRQRLASNDAMNPPTRALAQTQLALALGNLSKMDVDVDLEEIVTLCREAHETAPSVATQGHLVHALLLRSDRSLAASQDAYRSLESSCRRSLQPAYRIALALNSPGALGSLVLENPDVQEVIERLGESFARYPKSANPWMWAMLKSPRPDLADRVRESYMADANAPRIRQIARKLSAIHIDEVLDLLWLAEMTGQPNDAPSEIARLKKLGVPLPDAILE